jgi:hypothetical protein
MFYQPEFPSIGRALLLSILSIMVSVALSLGSALSIEKLRFQSNRLFMASSAAFQRPIENTCMSRMIALTAVSHRNRCN